MASKEPDDDDEWCEKQNVEPCSIPGKTNLRSLPKRMNTWPKKNLMTMTSDVRMLLRLWPNRRFAALVVLVTSTYVFFVRIGRNFCLMASSPYGCFDWILLCKILTSSYDAWNALGVHTASELHSPLWIRENARSWLSDWSKPTDGVTKSGPTPVTHCGAMVSGKCEWCHRRRLMSWVTCHRKQVENVTFEAVTSGNQNFKLSKST